MKKLLMFGAGKIGRSFIGQLFSAGGYRVVFADISKPVTEELTRRGEYRVVIKDPSGDSTIEVKNVAGVYTGDRDILTNEIAGCDLAAVSVGQHGLPGVVSLLAEGLAERYRRHGLRPLDLIIAENMRDSADYIRTLARTHTGSDFPLERMLGTVETSIGKMVPIMPADVSAADPLLVYAEAYNTLIVDRRGFLNPVPGVPGLEAKENIKAWVDRKSYIHNLGHAAAAYGGYALHPGHTYIHQALEYPDVSEPTRGAMRESAAILMRKYPGEFTPRQLDEHIDDLISRFSNRALGDTIYRVGCDLNRKLGRHDRILSPIRDGMRYGLPVDNLIRTFCNGLGFRAPGPSGEMFPGDALFAAKLSREGLWNVLTGTCGLNCENDRAVIERIMEHAADRYPGFAAG